MVFLFVSLFFLVLNSPKKKGIVIVYDITNKDSFDHVERWLGEIKTFAGDNVEKILVANKCDLESKRVIPTAQGEVLLLLINLKLVFSHL